MGSDPLVLTATSRPDEEAKSAVDNLFSADLVARENEAAALRAIVRDILRDELEGGLGERATANIRAVIRQEIEAVLAERRVAAFADDDPIC